MRQGRSLPRRVAIAIVWFAALVTIAFLLQGAVHAARLDSVDTAELKVPLGHSAVVTSLALSPDGKWLFSGSWDESARLWDVSSGREIHRFEIPGSADNYSEINAVAISPDGKRAFTVGSDPFVRVWSLETGLLLRSFPGHWSPTQSVAVSENGALLATSSGHDPPDMQFDNTVRLWDVSTGKPLHQLSGHSQAVMAVRFLAGGSEVVSASLDGSIRVWRTSDGKLLRTLKHGSPVRSIAISGDQSLLVSGGGNYAAGAGEVNAAKLWDLRTGQVIRRFKSHSRDLSSVSISPDGRRVLTASFDGSIRLWRNEAQPDYVELIGVERRDAARTAVFSADGNSILIGNDRGLVRRWSVPEQRFDLQFGGDVSVARAIAVSPDQKTLASANQDGTVRLFTIATGEATIWPASRSSPLSSIVFSPDSGMLLTTALSDRQSGGTAQLWDARSGRLLRTYEGHSVGVECSAMSSSGRYVATGSEDGTARVYETQSRRLVATLAHKTRGLGAVLFSPDERFLLTAAKDNKVRRWDIDRQSVTWLAGGPSEVPNGSGGTFLPGASALALSIDGSKVFAGSDDGSVRLLSLQDGSVLSEFEIERPGQASSLALSADGYKLLVGGGLGGVQILQAATGIRMPRLVGHTDWVIAATFLPNGLIASSSGDGTLRIWREETGKELASIVSFTGRESVIVDPEGRFDAPRGGESSPLYWVVGRETIELDQLKERFFVPGLLGLKLSSEELPSVESFGKVALHPSVAVVGNPEVDANIVIKVSNRGGGIGPVRVKLNGKEIAEDARPGGLDPNAAQAEIRVNMEEYRARLRTGSDNALEVQAFNQEGYLRSRGGVHFASPKQSDGAEAPRLWAVVIGVSNYSQPSKEIDLKYAAKDAADIAYALELGGAALFGRNNIDITLLASGQPAGRLPSRANIQAAFDRLSAAGSKDVVVVYLSGHGLSHEGEYYFPTQEATSLELSDPGVRATRSISGRQIAAWLKTNAEKQVLMLDTCAAGAVVKSLAVERSVPTDQVRAIDRMKDRAGLYILMGAAADRVSYEATSYRQGLLTHAILKAMSGAMLREDKFVNVAPLMDYAVDEVTKLALSVGGVQKPYVATPKEGTRSFDIGLLDRPSQQRIPLRSPKVLVLRPVLLNQSAVDDLSLSDALTDTIRKREFAKNADPSFVFVDADRMAGAVKPSGIYSVDAAQIEVRLVLSVNAARKQITVRCALEKDLTKCTSSLLAAIEAENGWMAGAGGASSGAH